MSHHPSHSSHHPGASQQPPDHRFVGGPSNRPPLALNRGALRRLAEGAVLAVTRLLEESCLTGLTLSDIFAEASSLCTGLRDPQPFPPGGEFPHAASSPEFVELGTIVGGLTVGGSSSSALRARAREVLSSAHAAKRPRLKERPPLSFVDKDLEGIISPHSDALVISARIGTYDVQRLMIDTGSSCDVLFLSSIRRMGLTDPAMDACPSRLPRATLPSSPLASGLTVLGERTLSYSGQVPFLTLVIILRLMSLVLFVGNSRLQV